MMTREKTLVALEEIYEALEPVSGPEVRFALSLLSKLGDRLRGDPKPVPTVARIDGPAPWEGVPSFDRGSRGRGVILLRYINADGSDRTKERRTKTKAFAK